MTHQHNRQFAFHCEQTTANDAGRQFSEWASLFPESLFVILQVFADESVSEGGNKSTPVVPSFCGYIDSSENWKIFTIKWQKTLRKFRRVPYFHFREFSSKRYCNQTNSHYYKWSERERDSFLYQLALRASESPAIPIGGFRNLNESEKLLSKESKFEMSVKLFYEDLFVVLRAYWPNYNDKVHFVFDLDKNKNWSNFLLNIHKSFQEKDTRLGGLTFENDKNPIFSPLQAADLNAFVNRQYIENWKNEGSPPKARVLDFMLLRNRSEVTRKLSTEVWQKVVDRIRNHQKATIASWKRKGLNQKYSPELHFPFEKYEIRTKF